MLFDLGFAKFIHHEKRIKVNLRRIPGLLQDNDHRVQRFLGCGDNLIRWQYETVRAQITQFIRVGESSALIALHPINAATTSDI
jgi:hypothetical protein